jgi:hypothetical protein
MAIWDWSLTAGNNATADANINWQEGQNPSTVNNSARAMMAALKAGFNDIAGVSALGGSGNTFTLSLSQALPSLTNAVVGFFATRSNTGAVTLNVDSTGAKPLRITSGVDLASGEIVDGQFYICAYNTSDQEWVIVGCGTIQNSRLATMANNTVKGNVSGSTAVPSDVSVSSLATAMGAVLTTRTLTAGTGLSGGGDLSANRSFAIADTAVTPGSYTRATITVDQQGRLTAAADGANELPSQTGNSGKYLTTDGTTASWGTVVFAKGSVSSSGTLTGGVNCSASKTGTGAYSITFTSAAAASTYTVVATANSSTTRFATISGKTVNGFSVDTFNVGSSPTNADVAFEFIVIGT